MRDPKKSDAALKYPLELEECSPGGERTVSYRDLLTVSPSNDKQPYMNADRGNEATAV